jgi:release factor glutamine methyltransferase
MYTTQDSLKKYSSKIDPLDLELIISRALNKPREFVLAHPEFLVNKKQESVINKFIKRRVKGEPLAYILGEKEFYGLDFKINKDVLIPRPETEMLVEEAINCIQEARNLPRRQTGKRQETIIIDVGAGSGNIIISLAKNILLLCHSRESGNPENNKITGSRIKCGMTIIKNLQFIGIDINEKALKIAKFNAKKHKVDKKIRFLHGNLLKPLIGNWKLEIGNSRIIILANLPYVSSQNYKKYYSQLKYEPKSALLSKEDGLAHYKNLFKEIKKIISGSMLCVMCYVEISPEQKNKLNKLVKLYFPTAKIEFRKDLSGKWRICVISLKH